MTLLSGLKKLEAYLGNARVSICPLDASGVMKQNKYSFLGNITEINLGVEEETKSKKEMVSGHRVEYIKIVVGTEISLSLSCDQFDEDTIALYWKGDVKDVEASTAVVTKTLATDASIYKKEDIINLAGAFNIDVDTFTLMAGGTAMVANVDFILQAKTASIVWLSETPKTGALECEYKTKGYKAVSIMTNSSPFYAFLFEGVNSAIIGEDGEYEKFKLELHKIQLSAATDAALIGEDFASFPIVGSALADPTKRPDESGFFLGNHGAFYIENKEQK